MRITIREGVFETNSSSIHAITISSGEREKPDKHYDIRLGSYGYGSDKLTTVEERASYLWSLACCISYDRDVDTICPGLRDRMEACLGYDADFDERVDAYGAYDGAVDHAHEAEVFLKLMMNDDDALRAFLLGKNSAVDLMSDGDDEYYSGAYRDYRQGTLNRTREGFVFIKGN